MRLSRTGAIAAGAALMAALAGCGFSGGGGGTGTGTGAGGEGSDSLTMALQFTPLADWALATDDAFVLTQIGCLETLIRYDAASGELVPMLATEWEQTEPTAWDFTLREGVTFQDGSPMDAEAVASALQHLLEVDVPPRPFTPEVIAGVEALDEQTVRVTTREPSALIPFRLAAVNTGILAPSAYTDDGIEPKGACTGPFEIAEYVPNQFVKMESYDDYWGGESALATVEGRFFPEGATRATQVRTGESQIALGIPVSSLAELEADPNITVSKEPTARAVGLYFNTSVEPWSDPAVRRAVQQAINLEAIATSIYEGAAEPASGPFAPNLAYAPPDATPVTQDVDAARAALKAAGYSEGDLSVSLLAYTERPEFADLAAVLQEQLGQIGIQVEIKSGEYASIEPSLLGGDYDLALLSRNTLADIADPLGYLQSDYGCEGTYNISHFCDPALDAKLAEANSEVDPAARAEIYQEVAQRLQEDAVTVFLVYTQTIAAFDDSVQGFVNDPLARYAVTTDLARSAS